MVVKNKYAKHAHISERKFRLLIKLYAEDLNATQISHLTGISRHTINKYLQAIRKRITTYCESDSPLTGEIEVDESYFGAKRVKGKLDRGAYGKTIVFGLLKRKGKVYTEVVPDVKAATLQALIRRRVDIESVIHSDGWRGYDVFVDIGYDKHFRVHHGENVFARGECHINGIESFLSYALVLALSLRK